MPKVSVIIPIYNAEKYIRQCLDSVINQSLKDIEIICVDDGSTDSTKEILEEYSKKDNRIIVINQRNLYAGVARNNALKIAKGEYVHFLDADDWVKKNAYKYLYEKMLKNNVDVIFFQYTSVDIISKTMAQKRVILKNNKKISNIKENPEFFIKDNAVVPWNKFYKREFIIENNIKFDSIIAAEDKIFYIHTILLAKKIMVLKRSLIYHRENNKESLCGETRFKNYDVQFKCYESTKKIVEKERVTQEEKRMILDTAIERMLYFYHQSYGEHKENIYQKLHEYFQNLDVSFCQNKPEKYGWWTEYIAIKNDDGETAEKEFERSRNNKKNKFKEYFKYVKKHGIYCAFYFVFANIIFKLKLKKK